MIGYVQLYFKISGGKGTYYVAFDGDFGKPISRFRLWSIKRSILHTYSVIDKIYSVEFCSKEEWEQNRCDNEICIHWDDKDGG